MVACLAASPLPLLPRPPFTARPKLTGILGQITTLLGSLNLNIAQQLNTSRDEIAYNVVDLQDFPEGDVLPAPALSCFPFPPPFPPYTSSPHLTLLQHVVQQPLPLRRTRLMCRSSCSTWRVCSLHVLSGPDPCTRAPPASSPRSEEPKTAGVAKISCQNALPPLLSVVASLCHK